MHGGDIYRNSIHFDFSVNTNPLGVPPEVQWVLTEAALHANKYPDIIHEQIIKDTANALNCLPECVVYGNGASELIMALCHTIMPKKAMVVSPCFSGYEYCLKGAVPNIDIVYYYLKEENDFALGRDFIDKLLAEKPKLLFLTNPNNPNGRLIDKELLQDIIKACDSVGTYLVIDECFLPLTGKEAEESLAFDIRIYKALTVLRAFTKTFAIPGVRVGYCVCSKATMAEKLRAHLPEWNLSIFAQMAGVECLKHLEYVKQAAKYVEQEREFLSEGLKNLGFKVFGSQVNYILFKTDRSDLKEKLLDYSILIRDCSDYPGLGKGYYRVAVKMHNENEGLLSALGDIINKMGFMKGE